MKRFASPALSGLRFRKAKKLGKNKLDLQELPASQRVRYFLLGTVVGAAFGSLVVSLVTQYVEHGDILYPARVRLSRKGKHVDFELLLQ
jgi:hypothetical protein